jgi:hypothetical protein
MIEQGDRKTGSSEKRKKEKSASLASRLLVFL